MTRYAAIAAAILFAVAGLTVACTDLRDHITVPPTPGLPAEIAAGTDESLTINEAKREVEVVVQDTARWVSWREQDIAKREQLVAFIEGFASAGFDALAGELGAVVGPFAPLVTLLGGYFIKRKGDKTPDELRQEKEDSYNAGLEAGRLLAAGLNGSDPTN